MQVEINVRPVPGEPGLVAGEDGYLYLNGKWLNQHSYAQKPVYMLICIAWHGPRPFSNAMVCHKNDVSIDNRPSNLYWGTPKQNAQDAVSNGCRSKTRVVRNYYKLDSEDRKKIREMYGDGFRYTIRELADTFNVSVSQASKVIKEQ